MRSASGTHLLVDEPRYQVREGSRLQGAQFLYKARTSLHIVLPSFLSTMISRGLAKVAGMLATDGKADGQTFLGEAGFR